MPLGHSGTGDPSSTNDHTHPKIFVSIIPVISATAVSITTIAPAVWGEDGLYTSLLGDLDETEKLGIQTWMCNFTSYMSHFDELFSLDLQRADRRPPSPVPTH